MLTESDSVERIVILCHLRLTAYAYKYIKYLIQETCPRIKSHNTDAFLLFFQPFTNHIENLILNLSIIDFQ